MKYVFFHLVFILLLFGAYRLVSDKPFMPAEVELSVFDADHYISIKDTGYHFNPSRQSNVAFFPAFPYLWKITGLNATGISLLNIVIFSLSFSILARKFSFTWQEQLLLLSVPSMFFMYVPYSEALFFALCVLLLLSLEKSNNPVTVAGGFFLTSITRSAANIFLPAILLTEWIDNRFRKWQNIIFYSLACLAGIALVAYIQYWQTGYAFGFIQTQQYWEHKLQWPKLRFTSWGQYVWLDAAAFLFGVICMYISAEIVLKFRRNFNDFTKSKALVFSVLCIAGLTFLSLIMKGGSFFSLNRYIFPSAFFCIAFVFMLRLARAGFKTLGYIFLVLVLFFTLFHFFVHISLILKYIILSLYLCMYFLLNHKNAGLSKSIFWLLYICNCILQVYLANEFLDEEWVG